MKHDSVSMRLFCEIEIGRFNFCKRLIQFLSEGVEWSNREIAFRADISKDTVLRFLKGERFEVKDTIYNKFIAYALRILEENAIFEKVDRCSPSQPLFHASCKP